MEKLAKIAGIALEVRTPVVLKRQIGLLLGSFPNAALPNADTFVDMLIFDVTDAGYSDAIVYLTCRDLRRQCRFFPTIGEFISTAERHRRYWENILKLREELEIKRQQLEAAVAYAERSLQQAREGVEAGWRDEKGTLLGQRFSRNLCYIEQSGVE